MKKKTIFGKIPGVLWGLIAVFILFSVTTKGFLSAYNIQNLLRDGSILIIVAMGLNLVILTGRMNISVGAEMSLIQVVCVLLINKGIPVVAAVAISIALGFGIGGLIGFLHAKLKFNDWVCTYAFMGICQGLALVLAGGNTVKIADEAANKTFRVISDGKFLGIFGMLWAAIFICIFMIVLTTRTKYGYDVYSMGGSETGAQLSGINTKKILFFAFAISGTLAAVSGVMNAAKANSASPIAGNGFEFDSIAASLIGGSTFDGGIGMVGGAIIGAMLMRTLRNGLSMAGFSPYWQTFIIGAVVMGVIIVSGLTDRRRKVQMLRRVYRDE